MSRSFPLNEFSGGFTSYIFNVPPNTAERFFNFHIRPDKSLEVRNGSDFYNSAKPKIQDTRPISNFLLLDNDLLVFAQNRLYNLDTPIVGPTGNDALFSGTASSRPSYATLGDEVFVTDDNYSFPVKIYRDQNGVVQLRSAGLPIPSTTPTAVSNFNYGKSYLYALVYRYNYTIETTDFLDVSAPFFFEVTDAPEFDGVGKRIDFSGLPELDNLSIFSYDTSNIIIDIYRTTSDAGAAYFKVGEVANGVTTFTDETTDSDLVSLPVLYTSEGITPNDSPPRCKFLVESNKAIWYLNINDFGNIRANRGRQSVQYDGDSCPQDFFFDVDADITGGGSVNDRLVVFTEN